MADEMKPKPSVELPLEPLTRKIQTGKLAEARAELVTLLRKKVPRESLVAFAGLCRRSGLAEKGVRLLHPIVHPAARRPVEATPDEKTEYAACLTILGAQDEALELLATVDPARCPAAYLARAYAEIRNWNYGESIEPLRAFAAHPKTKPYEKRIAKVNLVAALVQEGEHRRALPLLGELLHDASIRKNKLLTANLLEIATENLVRLKRYPEAAKSADKAGELLEGAPGIYEFFTRKWKAVLALATGVSDGRARLDAIRNEAWEKAYWESARDCDRYEVLLTGNPELLTRLLVGTPFPAFRRRIERELKAAPEPAKRYGWRGTTGGEGKPSHWLDLGSGESNRPGRLRVGGTLHRFLLGLASDFYRPIETATLFRIVYPGEFYHPEGAPHRVHQLVVEARRFFSKGGFPIALEAQNGSYRLRFESPRACLWLSPGPTADASRPRLLLEKLRGRFEARAFTSEQAMALTDLSQRSAVRLLGEAVRDGLLVREREGKQIRYRFAR